MNSSPIRRYADLIVHRQLWLALTAATTPPTQPTCLNGKSITDICEHINRKNRTAKSAQRDSSAFFQSLYFTSVAERVLQADQADPAIADAVIYEIRDSGFYVLLPKYPLSMAVVMASSLVLVSWWLLLLNSHVIVRSASAAQCI